MFYFRTSSSAREEKGLPDTVEELDAKYNVLPTSSQLPGKSQHKDVKSTWDACFSVLHNLIHVSPTLISLLFFLFSYVYFSVYLFLIIFLVSLFIF